MGLYGIRSNFNEADLNSFLSLKEMLSIAQENKYFAM